ncbi:SnoaL-like protein [Lacibacter cauensis]|uniref:SnoaL-like protein n=1 Tax=Lacibacter cauensis TaxID=510947 RepID=A0A562S962_9BACT|nr:nuclear transport factor 2 family protein [Lacibacter cauensis]TWI77912.1 SnoaL-like protein [Lacibacter cauensis]
MITTATAKAFATAWIDAWNSHSIENILAHYENNVLFYSPMIPLLQFNEQGFITNRTELKKYFETGLRTYPNLHFQLQHCFAGIDSVVLCYISVNGTLAAEVFELSENRKAIRVLCNYAT